MNFDILSTVELTASSALVVTTIIALFGRALVDRAIIGAGLTLWLVLVLWAGAAGTLGYDHGLGAPGLGAAVVLSIALLSALAFGTDSGRSRMREAPLPLLVVIQAVRILGISFVMLYAAHRLPAPFAPIAGWGDFAVGVLAIPLAWWAARDPRGARGPLIVWITFGILDLVTAVFLGATSTPGPVRLFLQPPGAGIMTTLPWIMIPCFLVPSLLFVHFAALYRLRERTDHLAPRALASVH